jgi:hypothetical protein
MQSLKNKQWWWIIVFIVVRLGLAINFPIFNDESIYSLWSKMIGTNVVQGLLPVLMDGKQPGLLIFWSIIVGWWDDPVLALRLSSIGLGLVTTTLVFRMYEVVTKSRMRWWQQCLYVLVPGIAWYESLGLQESAVMAVGAAVTYWCLMRFKKQDAGYKQGIYLGILFTLGILIKPTALFTFGSVVYFFITRFNKKVFAAVLIAICMGWGASQLIRLHPGYTYYSQRASDRISFTPEKMMSRLLIEGQWLVWWIGPLGILGIFAIRRSQSKELNILMFGWMGVLITSLFSGQGIFASRYIVAAYPLLSLTGIIAIGKTNKMWLRSLAYTWVFITVIVIFKPLAVLPFMKPFPAVAGDYAQYIIGWTSGWGVRESIKKVETEIGNRRGLVLIRADSGNPESATMAYFWGNPQIKVLYTANAGEFIARKIRGELDEIPVYFISRGQQFADLPLDHLRTVAIFPKPKDREFVAVYELK